MPSKKIKILFVKQHVANAKFVTNDIEILQTKNTVTVKNIKTSKGFQALLALSRQLFYLLFNSFRYDLFYIWFADYHSFLPVLFAKLLRKKSVICAGGYEATWIPEINCGVFTKDSLPKRVRNFCASYSLKNCSVILPVDSTLIQHENRYIYSNKPEKSILKDGIKHFLPELETPFITVPPGYDSELFKKTPDTKKEKAVISVGIVPNDYEVKRKGFDVLIEAAKSMNDVKFIFVGLDKNYIQLYSKLNLKNLEMHERISYEKLIQLYSKSKVYAQLSLFEGLPSAICEAMLCECVPVGTTVNGIPGIIKETGFIVENKNIEDIETKLRQALNTTDDAGVKARQTIIENFSYEKRVQTINSIIENFLLAGGP